MFHRLPNSRVLSEAWAFVHANEWFCKGAISRRDYENVIRSMLRLQMKPLNKVEEKFKVHKSQG